MENHSCLKLEPRVTDWVAGDGNLRLGAIPPVPTGDWTPYYYFYESQRLNSNDTDGCVLFSCQESFDAQIEQQMQAGKIPATLISLFNQLGFMDTDSIDGKAHFHSSCRWLQILTGNGIGGNNIYDPWDVIRKYGVLPYKDLPVDPTLTPQQYVDPSAITQAMKDKALKFLTAIGGKSAVQYHWILNNQHNFQATIPALQYSPLCDGVNVGQNWNSSYPPAPDANAPAGHCVGRIKDILPPDRFGIRPLRAESEISRQLSHRIFPARHCISHPPSGRSAASHKPHSGKHHDMVTSGSGVAE